MPTEMFGPYRLDAVLGRGGMGEVWRAFDTVRERNVALKRLLAKFADDDEFRKRFERESRVVARLNEPHIIPIHDFGEIAGRLYLTMRLVDGSDLASLIDAAGALAPAQAIGIVEQIAAALDAAHAANLVHRDIKPSNVLVTGYPGADFAYLVDFGIARTSTATSLTATGATIGTFDYMAPERLLRGVCDHRADIYALGCLLNEALTGQKPFPAKGIEAQLYHHVHTPPPTPSTQHPRVPSGLDSVVARAMAKNPDHRYPTAGTLALAARAALTARSDKAAPTITDGPAVTTRPPQAGDSAAPPEGNDTAAPRTPPRDPWETTLSGAARSPALAPTHIPQPQPTTSAARPHRTRTLAIALLAIAALVIGVVYLTGHTNSDDSPRANTNAVIATIPVGQSPRQVSVSPDGRRAYVPSADGVTVIDTASNTSSRAIGIYWGPTPPQVAAARDGHSAYFPRYFGNAVGIIDADDSSTSTTHIPSISVGESPRQVAVSPDGGHAYVTNYRSNTVSVIDAASNTVAATIPVGHQPDQIAISPDSHRAYVPNYFENTVSVIDTASNTVTATIPVGSNPEQIAISPDSHRAYVTDAASAGSVSVIDTTSNSVTATIPVGSNPEQIAISPDSHRAYVTDSGGVTVIDTSSNTVTATIPVGQSPRQAVISPDSHRAYVTNYGSNTVSVIDTASNTVTATIPVGHQPDQIAISPAGGVAYVSNSGSHTVTVINTNLG